jgi:hypothetical protein
LTLYQARRALFGAQSDTVQSGMQRVRQARCGDL